MLSTFSDSDPVADATPVRRSDADEACDATFFLTLTYRLVGLLMTLGRRP